MSVVRQTTKYHCDGCGYETEQPYEWRALVFVGSGVISVGGSGLSQDYCQTCVQKMRAAVRQQEKV